MLQKKFRITKDSTVDNILSIISDTIPNVNNINDIEYILIVYNIL